MTEPEMRISALPIVQPIGEFYVGVISHTDLLQISFADMRRIETELDRYVGIQRKLIPQRVKEIGQFVTSIDATFPTSIVIAVPSSCARYDESTKELIFTEGIDETSGQAIRTFEIAKILDGQHRIEGLRELTGTTFQLAVSVFIEADIADQAYVFATVNLAQTKVNHSLVYDLLDYAKARSPQKTCHNIAVALDKFAKSPLHGMIKRLGSATPGRSGETLTQATVVNSLLPFISIDANLDRDRLARGKAVHIADDYYDKTPFRKIWAEERDTDITRILMEYFSAIAERWPRSWASRDKGNMLPRTNGFKGFMRFLKVLYLHEKSAPGDKNVIIDRPRIREILSSATIPDGEFTTDRFPPGTSGEKVLFDLLRASTKI